MGKLHNLILIGDIPKEATEQTLKNLFQQYGQIKNIYLHHFQDFLSQVDLNDIEKFVKTMEKSKGNQPQGDFLGKYCLINFVKKETVEKCIYANVNIGAQQLLIMKVKEDEMYWVLKQGKKRGLKELAEADIDQSQEEDEPQEESNGDHLNEEALAAKLNKIINQLCQHVYISYKLKQDPVSLSLIDFFYLLVKKIPTVKLDNVDPKGIIKHLDNKEFKQDLLIGEIKNSKPDVLMIQSVFFWMKTQILIKFLDEAKLIEHYAVFVHNYFKPVCFTNYDVISSKILRTIWKINFFNVNYIFFETKIKVDKERNQHWIVFILSQVQRSYHYLIKAYYDYSDDFSDMFGRFDKFLQLTEQEHKSTIWTPKIEHLREKFDIKEIFPQKKDLLSKCLITVTNNLLSNAFFHSHPRRFVVEYIKSLEVLLSINSKRIFQYAGDQIGKNIPALQLCQSFPNIFKVIVLHRATYQLRKLDFESAILNMMDMLSAQNDMPKEDYEKSIEVT